MNEINKELIQQIETMRAQKDIKFEGPLNQVYAYMEAVSRIFEIAEDVQDQTNKIEEITEVALTCEGNLTIDHLSFSIGKILGIATRTKNDEKKCKSVRIKFTIAAVGKNYGQQSDNHIYKK